MSQLWRKHRGTYRGPRMACAPGTHRTAFALFCQHVPKEGAVIDLGACTGAFLARLRDTGFTDLHAVEYEENRIELSGVKTYGIDLNTDFANAFDRKFEVVICTEVIEHLDSPRHCLRQIHEILAADGYLLLSLPNIAHWKGRVKFLLSGELWGFGPEHYRNMRHISPVTHRQMLLMLEEIGYKVVTTATGGDFSGPVQRIAFAPVSCLFRLRDRRSTGDCAIYLARKTSPNKTLRYTGGC